MRTSCVLSFPRQASRLASIVLILLISSLISTRAYENPGKENKREDRKVTSKSQVDNFLENVLKSQGELKWIDRAVARINGEAALNQATGGIPGSRDIRKGVEERSLYQDTARGEAAIDYGDKSRDKRDFDQTYQTLWLVESRRYSDKDTTNSRGHLGDERFEGDRDHHDRNDFDDLDTPSNGHRGKERKIHVILGGESNREAYKRRAMAYHPVRDETEASRDSWNSNWKSGKDKREDPLALAYYSLQNNFDNGWGVRKERKARLHQTPKPKNTNSTEGKTDSPFSLASLKKTVLKLRKNLVQGVKKLENSTKSFFGGKDRNKSEPKRDYSRKNSNDNRNNQENDDQIEESRFLVDLQNHPDTSKTQNEGIPPWNPRRAEITSDHSKRASPEHLESPNSPHLNYHTKLLGSHIESEGSSMEEKRYLKEHSDKNVPEDGNGSISIARCFSQNRGPINVPSLPVKDNSSNSSKDTSYLSDPLRCNPRTSLSSNSQRDNTAQNPANIQQILRNNIGLEKSNVSRDLDMMENKPYDGHKTKEDARPWGNSLRDFSIRNELQPYSMGTFSHRRDGEKGENVGLDQRTQVIKVAEPQGHLFQNTASTKGPERIGQDEETGKSYQRAMRDKEPKGESENIKIVVKTLKKNVVQFRDTSRVEPELVNTVIERNQKRMRENNCTKIGKQAHLRHKEDVFQGQRKLLSVVEETEDFDNEAEEDENYGEGEDDEARLEEEPNVRKSRRAERSAKGKVNVLINQKIKTRVKSPTEIIRKRRDSKHVVEYYDYVDQDQDHEQALTNTNDESLNQDEIASIKKRRDDCTECKVCEPTADRKKNEHEEAAKEVDALRAKQGNGPREQIIVDVNRNASKEMTAGPYDPPATISTIDQSGNLNRGSAVNSYRKSLQHRFNKGNENLRPSQDGNSRHLSIPAKLQTNDLTDRILDEELHSVRKDEKIRNEEYLKGLPRKSNREQFEDRSQKKYQESGGPRISIDDLKGRTRPTTDDSTGKSLGAMEMEENTYFAFSANYSRGLGTNTGGENKCPSQSREATLQLLDVKNETIPIQKLEKLITSRQKRSIDEQEQMQLNPSVFHESFVEPVDWMDDFDDNARIRLGRSLKSMDDISGDSPEVGNDDAMMKEGDKCREKLLTTREVDLNTTSTLGMIISGSDNSNDPMIASSDESMKLNDAERGRAKRDAEPRDNALYDDLELTQRDSRKLEDSEKSLANAELEYNDEASIERRQADVKKRAAKKHKGHRKKKRKHRRGKGRRKHRKGPKKQRYRRDYKARLSGKHRPEKNRKYNQKPKKAVHTTKGKKREDQGTPENRVTENHGEKIAMLLKVDGIEDESQINDALHGELAGKIVDQVFEQVQSSDTLKTSLGPGLRRQHKVDDAISTAQKYRESLDKDDVERTEEQLRKVMALLSEMVLQEVRRKSCVSLSPDLNEFLDWILGVEGRNYTFSNYSMTFQQTTNYPNPEINTILYSFQIEKNLTDTKELNRKIDLLENLISQYNSLPEIDKEKIATVHDYLVKRLDLLLEYIEAKDNTLPLPIKPTNENQSPSSQSIFSRSNEPINDYLHNSLDEYTETRRKSRVPNHRSDRRKRGTRNKPCHLHREDRKDVGAWFNKESSKRKAAVARRKREYNAENRVPFNSRHATHRSTDTLNERVNVNKSPKGNGPENHSDRSQDIGSGSQRQPNVMNSWGTGSRVTETNVSRIVPVTGRRNDLGKRGSTKKRTSGSSIPTSLTILSKVERKGTSLGNKRLKDREALEWHDPAASSLIINDTERDDLPIKGKNRAEDEVILLNKREIWRRKNEEQLEEVAFGKDMRNNVHEDRLFHKLTEIDKKKTQTWPENNDPPVTTSSLTSRNKNSTITVTLVHKNSSNEDALLALERKINVYADHDDPGG